MFGFNMLGSQMANTLGSRPQQAQAQSAPQTMGFNPAYGMSMPMGLSREQQFNLGQWNRANQRPQVQRPQYRYQMRQPYQGYNPMMGRQQAMGNIYGYDQGMRNQFQNRLEQMRPQPQSQPQPQAPQR